VTRRFEPPNAVDEPDGVFQRPVEFGVDGLPVIARSLQFNVNGLRSIGRHFIKASELRSEFRLPGIEPNLQPPKNALGRVVSRFGHSYPQIQYTQK
jgi:hypothetical protein